MVPIGIGYNVERKAFFLSGEDRSVPSFRTVNHRTNPQYFFVHATKVLENSTYRSCQSRHPSIESIVFSGSTVAAGLRYGELGHDG